MTEREFFKKSYGLFRRLRYWDDRRNVRQYFQVIDTVDELELTAKESGMTESQLAQIARHVITVTEGKTALLHEPSESSLRVQIRVYSQRKTAPKSQIVEVCHV